MIKELLLPALSETLYMVFFSSIFAIALGGPLGIILVLSEDGSLWEKPLLNKILNGIINILRSFPFLILMIVLYPLSKILIGRSIGTKAAILPLSIASAPFVARLVETSLKEVHRGILEYSLSIGASPLEIVFKILLPEALPSLIDGLTLTIINLIGYSAMAGSIGGGGLGNLAINYGFHRFQTDVMLAAVLLIIGLVQLIQYLGKTLSGAINKK